MKKKLITRESLELKLSKKKVLPSLYDIVLSLDFIIVWGLGLVVLGKYDTVFFISFNELAEVDN